MILYAQNPDLELKVVTTITGRKEYRRNCKYIQSKYYVKDEDVFFVENVWYRLESGKIEFDHEKKVWVLKNNPLLIKGIVSFKNGTPVIGVYTPNVYNNCKVNCNTIEYGTIRSAINKEILEENGYFEDVAHCIYYNRKEVGESSYKKMIKFRPEVFFTNKGYNIEDNAVEFEQKILSFAEYPTKISKEARTYSKFLGDITFGAEIETSMGNVPEHLQYRTGIIACRDGSISSAEWVTVPMSGAKGLQNITDVATLVTERCEVDINCSLHYHFGNIPKDRLYLIALYTLAYKIQDEVFEMFPYYKTDPRGIKKKNYCQKLKQMSIYPLKDSSKEGYEQYVEEIYVRIFTFLSDGHPPSEFANKKLHKHPIRNKWERHSRYFWINLQNLIFSERFTAEFRLHTATSNKIKMTTWLFICNAILKYAEHNIHKIITSENKISFATVLNYYADNFPNDENAVFLSKYLNAYYKNRREVFKLDIAKDDKLSMHDLNKDKSFTFELEGKKIC